MKKEIIYIAKNGKKFYDEQACLDYEKTLDADTEKERISKLTYEIDQAKDEIEYWGGRVNQLKSCGPEEEYKYEATQDNIREAKTLPHIEQICVHAKNKYNVAINSTSYFTKVQRMHAIAMAASIYYKALYSRELMLKALENARGEINKWKKRLNELETWQENGNVKEIENEG